MLDLRTYRVEAGRAARLPGARTPTREISDPDRTITGDQQLEWLKDSLDNRPGRSGS